MRCETNAYPKARKWNGLGRQKSEHHISGHTGDDYHRWPGHNSADKSNNNKPNDYQ